MNLILYSTLSERMRKEYCYVLCRNLNYKTSHKPQTVARIFSASAYEHGILTQFLLRV